jgi:small neutral amino acid transporter SnatA (MarC family)
MPPRRAKSSDAVSAGIVVLFFFSVSPVFGKTITESNTNDNCAGSLRGAIAGASNGGTSFSPGDPAIVPVLTPLTLGPSVNLAGPGGSVLAISGGNSAAAFIINIGAKVLISENSISLVESRPNLSTPLAIV